MSKELILNETKIQNKIYTIRGVQVMLDNDLAKLYEVKTKRLNEQVKRNKNRFPDDFTFQLTPSEKNELVAKCDHLQNLKFSLTNPHVFTQEGVASLSGVLKSKKADEVNIKIMRAFVSMRQFITKNAEIFYRLGSVEKRQFEFEIKTDKNFEKLFNAMEASKPKQGIFFDGQIFDAYQFFSDLIREAKVSIYLIDNYVDDSVLTLLSKRQKNVSVVIYTSNISKQLRLDVEKYNSQYAPVRIKEFTISHDRFIIIDKKEIYHIGASLKDLGKKWFAFSKMNESSLQLLERLKKEDGEDRVIK